jgi:ATP-dependent RNA helicase DHX33
MKDKAGPSNAQSAKPNGIYADVRNVQMNGAAKRKAGDVRSSQLASIPLKKRIAYVDVSDEEDAKTSPRKMNGVVANSVAGSSSGGNILRRRKSKSHIEGASAKQLSLQEQRQQLPIARGTSDLLQSIMVA